MTDPRFLALQKAAGEVSRETFSLLIELESLVLQWAERINLVAPSTKPDFWRRHLLDSAQLNRLLDRPVHIVDFGSGSGFPALVLAILLRDVGTRVSMVESNAKKASFLRIASQRFAPDTTEVLCERVERVVARLPAPSCVTARAFAPLPIVLNLAREWIDRGTVLHIHKGRDYRREIAEAGDVSRFDLLERPSVIEPDGVILTISRAA